MILLSRTQHGEMQKSLLCCPHGKPMEIAVFVGLAYSTIPGKTG